MMKNTLLKKIGLLVFLLFSSNLVFTQNIDYQNVITVILDDGTPVVLYGKVGNEKMYKEVTALNTNRTLQSYRGLPGESNNINLEVGSSVEPLKYVDDYYFSGEYFYLPTNLRLSKRPDGVPEFLFLKYTTEEKIEQGGVQGGLMHFLMEWGLTPEQEKNLQKKLSEKFELIKQTDKLGKYDKADEAVVIGPAKLATGEGGSFEIISATLKDKTMAPTLVHSGAAPVLPGQKVAVAARLDKYGTQLLAATFEKNRSITDVSIECKFKYKVLMPAIKGKITVNWTKMYNDYIKDFEEKKLNWEHTHTTTERKTKVDFFLFIPIRVRHKTYEKDHFDWVPEVKNFQMFLKDAMSSKVIDFQLDNYSDPEDPIAQSIITTFTQALMQAVAADEDDFEFEEPEQMPETNMPDAPAPKRYRIDVEKIKSKMSKGIEVINLNYRSTIWEEVGITGNLGSWYNGVRNNPKCVSSVNLNDPFFQHRDINFILDLEAREMFGKEVNYVTVNVRKRRSSGNDFQDHLTIDDTFLENNGTLASITYARGEDSNPDAYEYKTQWSLKGGNLYPPGPQWTKGDWQGVTLAPPVTPRRIEFEGDLDELKEAGITRATLQLRYRKFDREYETNIPLTVSKKEPLVEDLIFTDRDQQGYAYRFILNHKKKGKLVYPPDTWETKINDDYVYAIIPDKLKEGDEKFIDKLLKAADDLTKPGPNGEISKGETVLEKFKAILNALED
jgi:hypothetical protein